MDDKPQILLKNLIKKLPTGKYRDVTAQQWQRIIEVARSQPHQALIVANYERSGHPACLNALLDNDLGGTLHLIVQQGSAVC